MTTNISMQPKFGAVHNFNQHPFGTHVMSIGKPETHPDLLKIAQKCKNLGQPVEIGEIGSRYGNYVLTGNDAKIWKKLTEIEKAALDEYSFTHSLLRQHEDYRLANPPYNLANGGDFGWKSTPENNKLPLGKLPEEHKETLRNMSKEIYGTRNNVRDFYRAYSEQLSQLYRSVQKIKDEMCRTAKPKG